MSTISNMAVEGTGVVTNQISTTTGKVSALALTPGKILGDVREKFLKLNYLEGTPLESLGDQMLQKKSPAQLANLYHRGQRRVGLSPSGRTSRFTETAYWDALYEEPCYIDPDSNSFDLNTAFRKLWWNWYILRRPPGNFDIDKKKLTEMLYQQKEDEGNIQIDDEKLERALELYYGDNIEDGDRIDSSKPLIGANEDAQPDLEGNAKAVVNGLGIDENAALEYGAIFERKSLIETALSGDTLSMLTEPTVGGNGTEKGRGNWYKFFFCFFFKFITGPVGLLLLKILPYFFKFLFVIINAIEKILFFLTSGIPGRGTPVYYMSKKGELKESYVNFLHTIMGYYGLVLPLGFINHKWGQVYGNGSFGKFIVSLILLSIGLIVMGGISIFVFLIVFIMFCGKTLAMFASNIDVKKKK